MKTTAAHKDESQLRQKDMIARHFERLAAAPDRGGKSAYTFVPGNLTELLHSFDLVPLLPEIFALQSAMRGKTADFIAVAERLGHSEDVCSYVKSDIGMLKSGNIGPTGRPLPPPDVLLLSYTGCFTFMKWFELLREEYHCPVAMLHVPYQPDGRITPAMRDYVVQQLAAEIIPTLERVSGKSYDEDRLKEHLRLAAQAEDDLVWVLQSTKHRPAPIDAYFGAVYYLGPIFSAFRGTPEAVEYYRALRAETAERLARGEGPITPDGVMPRERFRVVVEGPPNWTSFREFWKMFADEGVVAVASTYAKVGGMYDAGFRHDPERPLESLAEYCLGCYTNLGLPTRINLLTQYVEEYEADGFLINSVKSCNSFSAGQLHILKEVERRSGRPGGFIESDIVDPRYFSAANIKNRLESYFQMLEQTRPGATP